MSRPAGEWHRIVREFEGSGLSRVDFARLRGLHPSTLAWWCSRVRSERKQKQLPAKATAVPFVELAVVEPAGTLTTLTLHLSRVAGVIEIPAGVDLKLLRAVVDALC